MFDAVVAGKARLDVVIDGVGKQPREDLITSALFGTIRFLSPVSRSIALEALIGAKLEGVVDVHLWPYLRGDGENAEPDVVLKIDRGRGLEYWVVEVKWGASLGDDQIGREIRTVRLGECRRGGLPNGDRKVVGYTLIGAVRRHAAAMEEARRDFGQHLSIYDFQWTAITERLRRLFENNHDDSGLAAWAILAARFLDGQPEGSVLGEWPEMTKPEKCAFAFNADERFDFAAHLTSVKQCSFNFEEAP